MSGNQVLADIDRAVELAEASMSVVDRDLEKMLPKVGPGFRMPKDEDLPKWLAEMRKLWPPDHWVMPDGREVFESIYVLALPYIEGGREVLEKIRDLTEEY